MAIHIFRFLDLPAEIRLMIYDVLPITIKHRTLVDPTPCEVLEKHILWNSPGPFKAPVVAADASTPSTFKLIIKAVPLALRATCRQIRKESFSAFQRKLIHIEKEPLRLIVDAPALKHAVGGAMLSLASYIDKQRAIIREHSPLTKGIRPSLRDCLGDQGNIYNWQGLPLSRESSEYDQICECVYECAASIEARSPPYRSVAVLVLPHMALSDPHEIERVRMSCQSNLWGTEVRDCLNVEYSVPAEVYVKMHQKQLFVPVSHDEIHTVWGKGISYT